MLTIRIFDTVAILTEDEIICENEFIKEVLLPFLEKGYTRGPHKGYISRLCEAFGENVELISVEGEDPDVVY
jgi:hypothetical protein